MWVADALAEVVKGERWPEDHNADMDDMINIFQSLRGYPEIAELRTTLHQRMEQHFEQVPPTDGRGADIKRSCLETLALMSLSYGIGTGSQVANAVSWLYEIKFDGLALLSWVVKHPAASAETRIMVAEQNQETLEMYDVYEIASKMPTEASHALWARLDLLMRMDGWRQALQLHPRLIRRIPRWIVQAQFVGIGEQDPDLALRLLERRSSKRVVGITPEDVQSVVERSGTTDGRIRARAWLAMGRLPDAELSLRVLENEEYMRRETAPVYDAWRGRRRELWALKGL